MKNILITGGTGYFGHNYVSYLIKNYPKIKRLVIYSRDEMKQYEMMKKFPVNRFPFMRYFIGDIRDRQRLSMALNKVDYVIHAAALKHVPVAEYNPIEFIKTNIIGAQNIIETCIENDVRKVVALSTDKAASPINLYGATKLCSDKLFVSANQLLGSKNLKFSVVRYGNVMGSRGSVIPFFIQQAKQKTLPITDNNMTRFNITIDDAISLVQFALNNCRGGEIFVPKLASYNIENLAHAISPNSKIKLIGIRPGEKIHEELITQTDSLYTYDIGKYYVILNKIKDNYYYKKFNKVKKDFSYNSGDNKPFLKVKEIRDLIKKNVDKEFKPI
jgi:UDP-N-acetylglucosamine 4,6-dehydratase/5-epimerase